MGERGARRLGGAGMLPVPEAMTAAYVVVALFCIGVLADKWIDKYR